jgi:hypothetical protein
LPDTPDHNWIRIRMIETWKIYNAIFY